jgi:hypothetical protein
LFNDIIEEGDETVIVTIDSIWNASLGAQLTLTHTIFDDDGVGWIGPGGVSDDGGYQVWLKSDAIIGYASGSPLDLWEDASINNNDAYASAGLRPTYYDSPAENINNRPVVDYSGGDYYLEIANSVDFNTGGPYTKKTLFVAFRTGADVSARQVIYEQGGGSRGLNIYIHSGLLRIGAWNLIDDDAGATTPWGYSEVSKAVGINETHYAILEYDADDGTLKGYIDGSLEATVPGVGALFAHSGQIGLGGMNNGSYFHDGSAVGFGNYFGGKITEFLYFNRTLNDAQKIIIENYLGAKYNIAITNDYYAYEALYDYEVFGLGRVSSGNSHIISQGSGIIKLDNPNDVNDGEYLFVGHDNADLSAWTNIDTPYDSIQRISREWRVGETGELGTLRLALDTTQLPAPPAFYDTYLLMIDSDGDSDFTTGTIQMIQLDGRYGEFARVSGLNLNDGDVFTFAIGRNISLKSGAWNDPTTWLLGVPASTENAIILTTHVVNLTQDEYVGYLSIATGGEFQLGTHTLFVTGQGIENNGVFNQGTGSVNYNANGTQCIAPLNYYNLVISGSGVKTLCGNIFVQNDLELLGFPASLFLDADAANNYNIEIDGDWRTSGVFIPRNGTVTFSGGPGQLIYREDASIENFYNLFINSGTALTINHDIIVANELRMNGGNISNTGRLITLGINSGQTGTLTRTSGTITGKLRRWFNSPASNGTDIIFPVGTSSNFRPVTLNFDNITNGGTITANFLSTNPGSNGLPLIDDGVTFNQAFPEGYWPLSRENGLIFSGNYDVQIYASGFSTYDIDTSNRVIARVGSASNWQLIGDHINAVDTVFQRENISGNIYQFGISSSGSCQVSFTSCPSDISVSTDPATCSAVVTWTIPSAIATCGGLSITSSHSSGDAFPPGVTTVRYIATDLFANADTCEFTVTVSDYEPPLITTCASGVIQNAGAGCTSTVPEAFQQLIIVIQLLQLLKLR